MSAVDIRKSAVTVEEIWRERGPRAEASLLVAVAAAVIVNPFAGRFEADLMPFMAELRSLGALLAEKLAAKLGGADRVASYGKGAIVGEDGELEHAALWHEAGGWALRDRLGNRKAIVPAAKTVGVMGTRLMIPLGHTRNAYVRSHFATAELCLWDAPRRDEILYALAGATGPRRDARCGGLKESDLPAEDAGGSPA